MSKSIGWAAALAGAILLSGCVHYSHQASDVVHDDDLTFDDFDGTVSFGGEGMLPAVPPVDVHEFDPEVVGGQGGTRLIDGPTWLNAGDGERNQLLLDAEKTLPPDSILVLVVATGEVWSLGAHAGDLIGSGAVVAWSGDDYDDLYEYYYGPEPSGGLITRADFTALTAVYRTDGIPPPAVIHDLGPIGRAELKSGHGFEIIAPHQWNSMTTAQRGLDLGALEGYLEHLPAFQGAGRQPAFAVSVSWGMVYAAPRRDLDELIGRNAVSPWNVWQAGTLPDVLPGSDRPIRSVPLTVGIDTKF